MSYERTSIAGRNRVAAATFIAAVLMAVAAGAAVKKADWVGDYTATAMGTGHVGAAAGRASRINIEIYRWTTPAERQTILDLIATGDGKKIRAGLDQLEHIGRIRVPGEQGYELVYAWQVEEGGKKHVIAAMNRPFMSLPGATTGNSVDFLVGVAMLDPAEATGVIAPAIELAIKPDGQIDITESAADPVKFTNVKSDK
jgi:hypothetical protein